MPIAMTDTERFLIALAIIFGLPYAIWRLGRTDYWAPLVVVQIITGIVLGPGLLGAAFPACYHAVFEPRVVQALNGVAWWGVMLFVWIAGIELDLKEVWRQRRECGTTAALALGTPLLFGAVAAAGMLAWRGPVATGAGAASYAAD
jgi:Kef-type K+ transport system membrane component KefB